MPGKNGLELIKELRQRYPGRAVLILSMYPEDRYAVRALKAGASGYLTKESASAQLVSAIRKVAGGGAFITNAVAEQLALGAMPQSDAPPHHSLSDREFQVLRLLVAGKTVSEIAEQLNLSVKTVSTHKARIMQKMNMSNPTELIRYAIQHGLIEDSGSGPA
jgi:DNA-binding NarL/FixJ family response regulator